MSRLTFRDKQPEVCWQKLKRDQHNDEGLPPVESLSISKAVIRKVSRRFAEQIILKYEWLGTMASTGYHYGIFFDEYCAGVCCFAVGGGGANVYAHKEFGVEQDEMAYLARGACVHWAPSGSNSKLISWSCKLIAKDTKAKIVIAYSDTDAGEIGTVYQACNWDYIGRGSSTRQWIAPNGRVLDQKLPYNLKIQKGGTRAYWVERLKKDGYIEQLSNPKHRYVYVLDKKDKNLAEIINKKKMDYPKRPKQATSPDQGDSGGAAPTRTLQ